jgi:hypothetical protein
MQTLAANGPSLWSEVFSFTTGNPPPVPVYVSPADNALQLTLRPRLDWSPATGADYYTTLIAKDAAFTIATAGVGTAEDYADLWFDLDPGVTYYWKVRSRNASSEYSAFTAPRRFRIAYLAPTLASPGNGVTLTTTKPTFDWGDTAGATGYTIQVSTSALFGTTLVNTTVAPSTYTPTTALPINKVLRWRVRANGAYGPGPWSEVRSLIITP